MDEYIELIAWTKYAYNTFIAKLEGKKHFGGEMYEQIRTYIKYVTFNLLAFVFIIQIPLSVLPESITKLIFRSPVEYACHVYVNILK
jgi:hypothetical protein